MAYSKNNPGFNLVLSIIFLIPAALLLYAPFHQGDHQFYNNLRAVIMLFAAIFSVSTYEIHNNNKIFIGFVIIAVLFNSFLPIHLSKGLWAVIDITAAIFWIGSFLYIRNKLVEEWRRQELAKRNKSSKNDIHVSFK